MWGTGGEGALLGGAGGGVIALSSLSQGACVGRGSGLGPAQGETQPHKHTGHSTGGRVDRRGWAPYCTLGVGPGGDPLQTSLGRRLEAVTFPPSLDGGGETPAWGEGRRWAAKCPVLGGGRGLVPGLGRDTEGRPGQARVAAQPPPWWNPSPHTGSAAAPPFACLGLGGHREALVALTVRAAAADVRDFQLRVAVVLPTQCGLWTPGSWQRQARGCCQA